MEMMNRQNNNAAPLLRRRILLELSRLPKNTVETPAHRLFVDIPYQARNHARDDMLTNSLLVGRTRLNFVEHCTK